tara:strand:- start:299 stop:1222 length:924 start_codon:yes stop_codon:yes gene_type:complete
MTKILIKIFLLYCLSYQNSFASIKNNILVKIENEIITNFEIKNKILGTLILNNQEINQKNINLLKKQSLESLILLKLKKIELSKYDIKNNNSEVENYINKLSSNKTSEVKLKFEKNGLDFNLFFKEVETQLKWQKLIYQIYSEKIKFDKSLIEKELNQLVKNKKEIVQFRISEIEIFIDNKENENEKILNIKELINNQGFENTALKYSVSNTAESKGDLGWINSNSLSKEIFDIISQLKIGEITEPIKRQNSILFLKLVNKKTIVSKQLDKAELEKNLINRKTNELFNLYSKSHLSKLKNTSFIEYR